MFEICFNICLKYVWNMFLYIFEICFYICLKYVFIYVWNMFEICFCIFLDMCFLIYMFSICFSACLKYVLIYMSLFKCVVRHGGWFGLMNWIWTDFALILRSEWDTAHYQGRFDVFEVIFIKISYFLFVFYKISDFFF